jgi:hypothetical protein
MKKEIPTELTVVESEELKRAVASELKEAAKASAEDEAKNKDKFQELLNENS